MYTYIYIYIYICTTRGLCPSAKPRGAPERGAMGSENPPAYQNPWFCNIKHRHLALRPSSPYAIASLGAAYVCHRLDCLFSRNSCGCVCARVIVVEADTVIIIIMYEHI